MKWKIFFSLLANLIIIAIVISILSSGNSAYETRVLSLLITILVSIIIFIHSWTSRQTEVLLEGLYQFNRLRTLLKDDKEELKQSNLDLENVKSKFRRLDKIYAINQGSMCIIWIICILVLIFA